MTCDEVIELMQRHLDGDLNDEEYQRMMHHLEACPECAEFKERLEKVDRDLASLPKVTPPFSLVDAILPQLQQLDAANGSGSVSEEAAARRDDAGRHAMRLEENAPQDGQARRKQRARGMFMRIGGSVAAAAVLGILIVNGLADDVEKSANQQMDEASASTANSYSASAETMSAADRMAPKSAAPEEQPKMEIAAEGELPPASADQSNTPDAGSADGAPGKELQPNGGLSAQQGGEDPETETEGQSGQPARMMAEEEPASGETSVPADETPAPAEEAPLALEHGEGGVYGIAAIPPAPEEEAGDDVGITSITEDGGAEYPELAAESAEYVAKIQAGSEDGSLQVVVADRFGDTVFVSGMLWSADSQISLLSWEEQRLTYAVTTPDGDRTFVIDASEGKETEIVE